MDQITRDLTYRADAVRAGCEMYGWGSPKCESLQEMWDNQHAMNLATARIGKITSIFLLCVLFAMVVFWLYFLYQRESKSR